jgi:hypothetical protein
MSTQNRLGGLVQRKGAAPRPAEVPQRGEPAPVQADVTPAPAPAPEAAPPTKRVLKSMTLKLEESEYELLREYSHRKRRSHQDVMRDAVLRYLKAETRQ